MNFRNWLSEKGDRQVAATLGVSRFTVRAWRLGTRSPRKEEARKLAALDPAMTLDVIYAAPETEDRAA